MVKVLYAGSFDPITSGHMDIIKQASEIFDTVIVGVAHNPAKKSFISKEKRVELIKECVKDLLNIEVFAYEGLTVDFAKSQNASLLIRGLRNSIDFEYEKQLSKINSDINTCIKTVFLISKPENSHISSSAVRELILHKQDISKYVPKPVEDFIRDTW